MYAAAKAGLHIHARVPVTPCRHDCRPERYGNFRYPSYAIISTSRNHRSRASVYQSIPNHNPSDRAREWLLLHFGRSCIPPVAPSMSSVIFRRMLSSSLPVHVWEVSSQIVPEAPLFPVLLSFPKGETTGGMLCLYLVGSLLQCFRPVPLQELS